MDGEHRLIIRINARTVERLWVLGALFAWPLVLQAVTYVLKVGVGSTASELWTAWIDAAVLVALAWFVSDYALKHHAPLWLWFPTAVSTLVFALMIAVVGYVGESEGSVVSAAVIAVVVPAAVFIQAGRVMRRAVPAT
jgi:hypothetical protein